MKKYAFTPDYTNVVKAARNIVPDRLPLYEHLIGARAMNELTGLKPYDGMRSEDTAVRDQAHADFWKFWCEMGYDTASMEYCITEALVGNGALGAHQEGCIKTREDFEKYPWDTIPDRFFKLFEPHMESFTRTRPEGMMAIGGVGNGVFECVQDIVGYINLCFIKGDDEDLYNDLFTEMGKVHEKIWKRFLKDYSDAFCVLRFGDDLGFNTATLISPADIRNNVLPVYRKVTDLVHATGRPFLLHSCGNLFGVFDDIIDLAKIDAKHSNEDSIGHFSVWVEKYGDRIGNFGGIDTDVLCRQSPEFIHDYVIDCLDKVWGHGGIAFASGNSIPDYVSPQGYLAMVETIRDWRGDKVIG